MCRSATFRTCRDGITAAPGKRSEGMSWLAATFARSRAHLATLEHRLALLDERRARFAMVVGQAAARLVDRLEVEHGGERLGLGSEEVLLHVDIGDARA